MTLRAAPGGPVVLLTGPLAARSEAIPPLTRHVTDKVAATEAVQRAHAHFGRLDVVVSVHRSRWAPSGVVGGACEGERRTAVLHTSSC